MAGKKVLIGYGSRFGATEEVAGEIARVLESKEINPLLVNLRKTKSRDWPSPDEFDGIIVASGMKFNKWTKEPKKYLAKYKNVLKKPESVLGLFVCSTLVLTDYGEAMKKYLEDVLVEYGIPIDDRVLYQAFGGVFDFSKDTTMGIIDKNMLKVAALAFEEESNGEITIDKEGKTDFRDWDQINDYANKFAALVKFSPQ